MLGNVPGLQRTLPVSRAPAHVSACPSAPEKDNRSISQHVCSRGHRRAGRRAPFTHCPRQPPTVWVGSGASRTPPPPPCLGAEPGREGLRSRIETPLGWLSALLFGSDVQGLTLGFDPERSGSSAGQRVGGRSGPGDRVLTSGEGTGAAAGVSAPPTGGS